PRLPHPRTPHPHTPSLHDALPIWTTWTTPTTSQNGNSMHYPHATPNPQRSPKTVGPVHRRHSALVFRVSFLVSRRATTATAGAEDRKSTRLNSSHVASSYAGFCLK